MKKDQRPAENEVESNKLETGKSSNNSDKKKDESCVKKWQTSSKNITQAIYLCQALSFLFGVTAIVGVIINYIKRSETRGTWLESHFTWQLRTFWFGLLFGMAGWFLTSILIGFLILAMNLVWIIYRVVKGWLLLYENQPVENSEALI